MASDFSPLTKNILETQEHLARELSNIRTGRATPTLLDGIKPEAYGARTPLRDIASVSVEDTRTLRIMAWDKELNKEIEKAITAADLGVSVSADDQGVRVTFPTLTEDRRTLLSKLAGEKLEQAKISVRTHRADTLHALEAQEKTGDISKDELFRSKEEVQKIIDTSITKFESMTEDKRQEITR